MNTKYKVVMLPKIKKEFISGYNQRLEDKNSGWVYEGQNPFDKISNYRVASTLQDYLESLGIDDSDDFAMWSEWFDELPDEPQSEQVDWEYLKCTIKGLGKRISMNYGEQEELQTFFNLLKSSPEFAIEAHYRLQ